MNKETIRTYLRWLESASDQELEAKRAEIQVAVKEVSSRDGRADLRLAQRLLEEETMVRLLLRKCG